MRWLILMGMYIMIVLNMFGMADAAQTDFRNIRWGMTKIEVMASESGTPESFTGPELTYRTTMLGKEIYLIYEFIDNKLIHAIYVFIDQTGSEYEEVEKILERKYGKKVMNENENSEAYYFKWETPLTEVVLKRGAGKDCKIEYQSKQLKAFRQKQENKKSIEKERELMRFF